MSAEPVGYIFQADIYCPECICDAVTANLAYDGWAPAEGVTMSAEENLSEIAAAFGIDRDDEHSFDSGDFPKVYAGTPHEWCNRANGYAPGQCGDQCCGCFAFLGDEGCPNVTGRDVIRGELSMTAGDDVYGWCLGWWFPIVELLYAIDPDEIPAEWGFRPAPALEDRGLDHLRDSDDYQTQRLIEFFDRGEITADDLLYWGRALSLYANLCKRAGRDY